LLREVDGLLLQGRGGYETRQEFFLDAIENQILEVKYGGAENGQRRLPVDTASELPDSLGHDHKGETGVAEEPPKDPRRANGQGPRRLTEFSETELHPPPTAPTMTDGLAVASEEPLFGLHNRDYPSLWAARQLALQTQEGFIPLKGYTETTTAEGWHFAESLEELDAQVKTKLTALFPKNGAKPQSAEENFKAFAIGTLAKKPLADGTFKASGPLYAWGVAQVHLVEDVLEVGLTHDGFQLLGQLAGISLRLPHEPHFAECFLRYLEEHAPADAAGFAYLLEVASDGLTRTELAGRFKDWQPSWSDTEANTHASAYVARAREWGLLEQTLVGRCYALTEFGKSWRERVAA
jgi:hypothetical protein